MKKSSNNLGLAALLCGAMIISTSAFAQVSGAAGVAGAPAGGNAGAHVGVTPVPPVASQKTRNDATPLATPSTVGETNGAPLNQNARANSGTVSNGVSANGDVNSGDLANNAGSVNRSTQTSSAKMARRAQSNAAAAAAEVETTRQLNQQRGSMSGSASTQP